MPLTAAQQTDAYRFFAIAFGAAPGVTYMNQIAAAYEGGASTKQIVNAFVSKDQFTSVYPIFFTNQQFAEKLVTNVVGSYATASAKTEAVNDIVAALNGGATRGDVIFNIFNNLAAKPATDAKWGEVSKLMANQVAVARYYTETQLGNTVDQGTLIGVLSRVTPTTDTSTPAAIVKVIGNDPPNAAATAAVAGTEDSAVSFTVAATDPNAGDVLSFTAGKAANGTVTGGAGGVFTYTPNKDFNGTDTVVVTVSDSKGASVNQTVTINVAQVNDAPTVAAAQTVTGTEDTAATVTVAGTDVDAGDVLTYTAGKAANGTVTGGAGGVFTYTPNKDYNGADSFTVTVTDKAGATATQTVTVNLAAVNDAPTVAAAQTVAGTEDTAATVTAVGADVDTGDVLTYTAGKAANGTVTGGAGGVFTYTPNKDYNGADSFTVTVTDKAGATATQTVTVNLAAVNDAPTVAAAQTVAGTEDTAATVTVAGTDVDAGDVLTYTAGKAANGTVTGGAGGVFTYTPSKDYNGADSFTVSVTDKAGATATQTVTVNLKAVNDAPVVVADATASVVVGTTTTIDVVANDTDVDGDKVSLTGTPTASQGTVTIVGGKLQYTAPLNYVGNDTISYTITDGAEVVKGTQTISVLAPSISAAAASVNEGAPAVFTIIGAPNTNYGVVIAGTATPGADYPGSIIQTVPTNAAGVGTLSLTTARDKTTEGTETITASLTGFGGLATVNLLDTSVNNVAPVFTSSATATTAEDNAVTFGVTATDANAEDTVTFSLGTVTGGTATITNGSVKFTPTQDFNGSASVVVIASDGTATTSQTVAVTVTPVNDAPTVSAATQAVSLNEDTAQAFTVKGSDVDGDTLTYTVSAATNGTVTGTNGSYTYTPNKDFNGTDSVVVTVKDPSGLSAQQTVNFTVAPVNDAAVFASASATATDLAENTVATAVVFKAAATDVDGNKLTYALAGADAALLNIDSATGEVRLNAAANFEAKSSYSFNVTATDGIQASPATQAVTLNITNVNEAPVVTSGATGTVNENAAASTVVYTATATDVDAGDAVTFSLGGADAALLNINAATGAVTLKASADFEAKPTYNFTVTGTDSGGLKSTSQAVVLTVNDVNDNPVAKADSVSTLTGFATTIDVIAGTYVDSKGATQSTGGADTDQDVGVFAGASTITTVTQPTNGGTVAISNNKIVFTSAVGYSGNDTFTYTISDGKGGTSTATVTVSVSSNTGGTSGNDMLFGATAAENIDGLAGNDTIVGGGGADTLIGGDGDDRITYRDAVSQILGGNGTDTLVIGADAQANNFTLGAAGNQVTGGAGGFAITANVSGMENLDASAASNAVTVVSVVAGTTSITTGKLADTITSLAAATGSLTVDVGAGNDTVTTGSMSAAAAFNVTLGDGDDNLTVTNGAAGSTISVNGGAGNDTITAALGATAFTVTDDSGNNTVTTLGGNDTVTTGAGNDTIDVGGGNNNVSSGAGNDNVTAAGGNDTIATGAGTDTISGGSGADSIDAGTENDRIVFATVASLQAATKIDGGANTDTVVVTAGGTLVDADLVRFAGVESLNLAGGASNLTLGANALTSGLAAITFGAGADTITVGAADTQNHTIDLGDGGNSASMGDGADTITLGTGADNVNAGAGNDRVSGGANVTNGDTLTGGGGTDTLALDGGATVGAGTAAAGAAGSAGAYAAVLALNANFTGFESITVAAGLAASGSTAGSANDYIITLGNVANVAAGATMTVDASLLRSAVPVNLGTDNAVGGTTGTTASDTTTDENLTLDASALNSTATGAVNVLGGAAADSVLGGSNSDTLVGNAGNDTLDGGAAGTDSLVGGAGSDTFNVSSNADIANVRIDGGQDTDTIALDAAGQTITDSAFANASSVEALTLFTGALNTVTLGTNAQAAGIVTVTAGGSGDSINVSAYTTAGVRLNGGAGADTLTGSAQGDTISGGAGSDSLVANAGADSITTAGGDTVSAGADNDTITLGVGADNVDAGAGDDRVAGGANVTNGDTLVGGAGTDTLVLDGAAAAGSGTAAAGAAGSAGAYAANLAFGASFSGFEALTLAAGLAVVGSTAGSANDYVITLGNATNVAAGSALTVNAGDLRAAVIVNLGTDNAVGGATGTTASDTTTDENLTFDASALTTAGGAVNVTGGAADDSVLGGANADTLSGGAGNDTLSGGEGADSIDGGAGNNSIAAGNGANIVVAGAGNDTITAGTGNDNITTGNGNNSVDAGAGNDTIVGGTGNDTITLGAGTDSVQGGAGSDVFVMTFTELGNDADIIDGGADSNTLQVTSGNANVTIPEVSLNSRFTNITRVDLVGDAAAGSDTFTWSPGSTYSQVAGIRSISVGTDAIGVIDASNYTVGISLSGGAGADTLTGSAQGDTISGGAGSDSLVANAGADSITTAGGDTVSAGADNDTITLGVGADNVDAGAGDDRVAGGANVTNGDTLVGGAGTDTLVLDGAAAAGSGTAAAGAAGSAGAYAANLAFGASFSGFEALTLAAGLAVVGSTAGSANDYVITLGNATNVAAGSALTVNAGDLRAAVIVNLGTDNAVGGATGTTASDTTTDENLTFDASALTTAGGAVNVTGGAADDSVLGGANADTLSGGAGNDTLSGGEGADSIDGGAGNNSIAAGNGANIVVAGAGNDTITAGTGNDNITTGNGNNSVDAGAGNDTIVGGTGNDTITGGDGTDSITLGGGSNQVRFTAASESTGATFDSVTGFVTGTDKVVVNVAAVPGGSVINLSGFASVASLADGLVSLTGTQANNVLGDAFYSTGDGKLYIDLNGDGQINQGGDLVVSIGTVAARDIGFSVAGGAGADTITSGSGADTLAGGAGSDVFNFAAGATGTPTDTNFDVITDYVAAGTDSIGYSGGIIKFATAVTAASGTAGVAVTTGIVSFNAADNTLALKIAAVANALGAAAAGNALIFQDGADSYLYITDGVAGVGSNDVLVRLVGVTGAADELNLTGGLITSIT